MYNKILIRFGELSTKGKNKMHFIRKLGENIKELMHEESEITFDRIYMEYKQENLDGLLNVFGIQSFSPIITIKTDYLLMQETILKIVDNNPELKTFKISAKRHWKGFEKNSHELNNQLGEFVLENSSLKVDIKNPDLKIEIEIRKNATYLFWERIKGLGGYPVGVNGKVLHMISGGIDSPVAAYELIKRGFRVDFLSFITPPHTDEKTVQKVSDIIQKLNTYQSKAKLYRSNYTDLMNLIGLTSDQAYKITLMRRSFYRIGTMLANKNKYLAIANGENLGQVASQTLESISVIQEQTNLPVFRPVLTNDKLETISQAIKIGTYEISIQKANESCELFAPKKPVIKPIISRAYKLESELFNLKELELENYNAIVKVDIK